MKKSRFRYSTKRPPRRSGRGERRTLTRRRYGGLYQNSQFRGVTIDRRPGRGKRWIARVAKAGGHHLCETEDQVAHVANLAYRVAFPGRFERRGYPNDTRLYTRPGDRDAAGLTAVWVNSPRHDEGYHIRVSRSDLDKLKGRVVWFDDGDGRYPKTPFLIWSGGRIRVIWMSMEAYLTGFNCVPREESHYGELFRGLLSPVSESEESALFSRAAVETAGALQLAPMRGIATLGDEQQERLAGRPVGRPGARVFSSSSVQPSWSQAHRTITELEPKHDDHDQHPNT